MAPGGQALRLAMLSSSTPKATGRALRVVPAPGRPMAGRSGSGPPLESAMPLRAYVGAQHQTCAVAVVRLAGYSGCGETTGQTVRLPTTHHVR
jgi:hypothetical protein